jgi:hypothetical protein
VETDYSQDFPNYRIMVVEDEQIIAQAFLVKGLHGVSARGSAIIEFDD